MAIRPALLARMLMAFAALAMIAAPVVLADGGAAHAARMAAETMKAAAMPADHCDDAPAEEGDHRQAPSGDCLAICLAAHSALASDLDALRFTPPPLRRATAFPDPERRVGNPPGIDPPPPRFA